MPIDRGRAKKMWSIHATEHDSAAKKKETVPSAATQMQQETLTQVASEKDKHMVPLVRHLIRTIQKNLPTKRKEGKANLVVVRGPSARRDKLAFGINAD